MRNLLWSCAGAACCLALLALVACQTSVSDPRLALITACDTWTATLRTLVTLRTAGQLTEAQIKTVDEWMPSVSAVCLAPPPDSGAEAAGRVVEAAVAAITQSQITQAQGEDQQ